MSELLLLFLLKGDDGLGLVGFFFRVLLGVFLLLRGLAGLGLMELAPDSSDKLVYVFLICDWRFTSLAIALTALQYLV